MANPTRERIMRALRQLTSEDCWKAAQAGFVASLVVPGYLALQEEWELAAFGLIFISACWGAAIAVRRACRWSKGKCRNH